jgi:predicted TIM-barrel fold metal-dependent hydrolase
MGTSRLAWAAGVALLVSAGLVAQQTPPSGTQGAPSGTQPPQGGRGGRGGPGGPQEQAPIQPGEECPPGMTEFRAGRCGKPAMPPPSIVDYRPKSTVVAVDHPVPRAKFPVVDIHNHTRITAQNIEQMIKEMDALNLRVMVNLSGGSSDSLRELVQTTRGSRYQDRFRLFANVNFTGAGGPDWAAREVAGLEQAIKDGAIGLKIFKGLGLTARKADGTRLKIDDPDLDPIWQTAARHNVPVIIHVADPAQFFEPIDYKNERWLELAIFRGREYPRDQYPSFEELMTERDRMFARNPKTRFINAHFGWHGNDLGRAAKHLDSLPNVVLEVGAVLYEFGRQPRAARDFFIKYQDRVLFGKDAYEHTEYPYYWRVFETRDEYFDYYRDYHAFWKLYGMDLPDDVLRKLYHRNALRVAPGLPQSGW